MAAFLRIRIANIGLFFSLSRLRLVQSHDPGTQFTFTFEHLKGAVLALPETNRGCRIGCLNCGRPKPTGDQYQEQIGKSRCIHRFVLGSQLGPSPDYSDESLTGCLDNTPDLSSREDRLTTLTSFVQIDEFLPYIARRVTIAFGYNNAGRENETRLLETRAQSSNIRSALGASLQSFLALSVTGRHTQRRQ
jgi:hypothetical protein